MTQQSTIKRLLLVLLVIFSLSMTATLYAQEGGAEGQEIGGEETGQVEGTVEEQHEGEATAGEEGADGAEQNAGEEEAASNPLTPLGINLGFLIAQIVNFGIIFLALRVFLWKPLMNMLDSRAARIRQGLEDSAAAANARRNAEAEAERILAAARADAGRVVEEARGRGEEVGRQVAAEAQQEAEAIRRDARARAQEERDRQLADLRGQVAAISIAVAQRLIGESLDEKRQQALISDFFSKVPADARSLQGPVEVVSAMPLSAEEQARVQRELGVSEITYSVDPSILGGLVIRTEQRVVDGSVRSGLNELSTRLR